ncbi:hypothetical protein [Brachybacterium paraconglomeratum]|uniref:hypothetical protein n=1 Tax=Brachybacterium paraconglomeratum TaxID=173362 RepID=UPI0035198F32
MSKNQKHATSRGARRIVWVLGTAGGIIAGALASLWFLPELLLTHWVGVSDLGDAERAEATLGVVQIVALAIGGIIAIVGVVISVSRHHEEVASNHRDQARLEAERDQELRSRYVTAVELLSDAERPIKRIAGLHALGALADDWQNIDREDEVQVCINTICDYLRQPPELDKAAELKRTAATEVAIRTTAFDIIRNHLHEDAPSSWSSHTFRLAGAHLDYLVDLRWARIMDNGYIDLSGAAITDNGSVRLSGVRITDNGQIDLSGATITDNGSVHLSGARITDNGHIDLNRATITDNGSVIFIVATITDNGSVHLSGARITDNGHIELGGATITEHGSVDFSMAAITEHGSVDFSKATITEHGSVDFSKATIADNGTVTFDSVTPADDRKLFLRGGKFDGGELHLPGATIMGDGSLTLRGDTITDMDAEVFELAGVKITTMGAELLDVTGVTIDDDGKLRFDKPTIEGDAAIDLSEASLMGGGVVVMPCHIR